MPDAVEKPSRRKFIKTMAAGAIAGVVPCAYGDLASNELKIERVNLELPKWDASGFKAAVLSDLHLVTEQSLRHALKAFELAIAERPTVVLIPGDLLDRHIVIRPDLLKKLLKVLEDCPCPVYASRGNHDIPKSKPNLLAELFRDRKSTLLVNETAEVDGVAIVGLDSATVGDCRPDRIPLNSLPKSVLCMLHEPDFVTRVPSQVSIVVSGHSHGGQICLPFGIPLTSPTGAKRYTSGYYPEAKVPLYVSRGVGTVGLKLRTFCPPEITILTLVGKNS